MCPPSEESSPWPPQSGHRIVCTLGLKEVPYLGPLMALSSSPQEKRIYDLKKKNQELEKFKFVLDYKIKELKKQIEPRENEIKVMKEQIQEVRSHLDTGAPSLTLLAGGRGRGGGPPPAPPCSQRVRTRPSALLATF